MSDASALTNPEDPTFGVLFPCAPSSKSCYMGVFDHSDHADLLISGSISIDRLSILSDCVYHFVHFHLVLVLVPVLQLANLEPNGRMSSGFLF